MYLPGRYWGDIFRTEKRLFWVALAGKVIHQHVLCIIRFCYHPSSHPCWLCLFMPTNPDQLEIYFWIKSKILKYSPVAWNQKISQFLRPGQLALHGLMVGNINTYHLTNQYKYISGCPVFPVRWPNFLLNYLQSVKSDNFGNLSKPGPVCWILPPLGENTTHRYISGPHYFGLPQAKQNYTNSSDILWSEQNCDNTLYLVRFYLCTAVQFLFTWIINPGASRVVYGVN